MMASTSGKQPGLIIIVNVEIPPVVASVACFGQISPLSVGIDLGHETECEIDASGI